MRSSLFRMTVTAVLLSVAVAAPAACTAPSAASGADDSDGARGTESVSGAFPVGAVMSATNDLNLRRSASTSSTIIDIVPAGDTVALLASSPKNGFYNVQWNDESGWCYGAYLSLVSTPTAAPPAPTSSPTTTPTSSAPDAGASTPADASPDSSPETSPTPNVGAGAAPWSCSGSWATTPTNTGAYDLTEYGCWTDSDGDTHNDSGDNCVPACLSQARAAGLCDGSSGASCEESVNYFIADAGRFGCMARVRVTNPANGKSVIAVVLDYGPACWVEQDVGGGVIDASGPVNNVLFGGAMGWSDRAAVQLEVVDASTPLGPE